MIALDEIKSTVKRLELLKNNSEDTIEQFTCFNLLNGIVPMITQIEQISSSPEYAKYAEEWANNTKK